MKRFQKGTLHGPEDSLVGMLGWLISHRMPSYKQAFFRPFWGDYWIIDLGKEYDYSVVGHPSRDCLWILSRTPSMDESIYEDILQRLRNKGYQLDRLQKTRQHKTAS